MSNEVYAQRIIGMEWRDAGHFLMSKGFSPSESSEIVRQFTGPDGIVRGSVEDILTAIRSTIQVTRRLRKAGSI